MITYCILTVPEREKALSDLLAQFRAAHQPEPVIYVDREHSGHYRAARAAWETIIDADYPVVMEDDVLLCDHFFTLSEKAILSRPADTIVFFNVSEIIRKAYETGMSWVACATNSWNQCIYYPKGRARKIMGFADEHLTRLKWWDSPSSLYHLYINRPFYMTAPSLVQHKNIKSSVGNPQMVFGKERAAGCFIPDVRLIDFTDRRAALMPGKPMSTYSNVMRVH